MKKALGIMSILILPSISSATPVPRTNICGTLIAKGTYWNGDERLERVIDVQGEKMGIKEFFLRYCQGRDAASTETCKKALVIGRLDAAQVTRKMPAGLCPIGSENK